MHDPQAPLRHELGALRPARSIASSSGSLAAQVRLVMTPVQFDFQLDLPGLRRRRLPPRRSIFFVGERDESLDVDSGRLDFESANASTAHP